MMFRNRFQLMFLCRPFTLVLFFQCTTAYLFLQIPFQAFAAYTLLDNFDSHTWSDSNQPIFQRGKYIYLPNRKTEGINAFRVTAPYVIPLPDGQQNRVEFTLSQNLPIPEDWSKYSFVTIDTYLEEDPVGRPKLMLTLYNSKGASAALSPWNRSEANGVAERGLVCDWSLYQWENSQMTWPLKGNTFHILPVPDEILKDIVKVSISVYDYTDDKYGCPLSKLNFHFDNLKLDGKYLWDSFDGPAWDWQAGGDSSSRAGITHNCTYQNSAGSLFLTWNYAGTANYAEVMTSTSPQPQDWSAITHVKAKIACSDKTIPLTVFIWDGNKSMEAVPQTVPQADAWQNLTWELPLPTNQFDKSHITVVKIVAKDINLHPTGVVYIDDLEIASKPSSPYAFYARPGYRQNYLQWRNSPDQLFSKIIIRCRTDQYPSGPNDGRLVCVKKSLPDSEDTFTHSPLTPGLVYYYCAWAFDGRNYTTLTEPVKTQASQNIIRFKQSRFEAGFSKSNGALLYIHDVKSGTICTGSNNQALWKITFLNESFLPAVTADTFSPDSVTRRFRYTEKPLVLNYQFTEAGRSFLFNVKVTPADKDAVDLVGELKNNTGLSIRTVSLPYALTFPIADINQVMLPIQEGLVLTKTFFENSRTTYLMHPPLFAPCVALDSSHGYLSIYTLQNSTYQRELLPPQAIRTSVFQPVNIGVGTIRDRGYINNDLVVYVPYQGEWRKASGYWKSPKVLIRVGNNFRQLAAKYKHDNGFDNPKNYPLLRQKLSQPGQFSALAKSPVFAIECFRILELNRVPIGKLWDAITRDWLPWLPSPALFHFIHWQAGKLEDNHPDCQPIFWNQYGSPQELNDLLHAIHSANNTILPFTDWMIWNKVDPATGKLPVLDKTPAAVRLARGDAYPLLEYNGYVVKPWHPDVITASQNMLDLYTSIYPSDYLFVDMTGQAPRRYIRADDNQQSSACLYSQGVIEHNRRLSKTKPLFTEGFFVHNLDSMVGFCQSIIQRFGLGELWHLGKKYEDWLPYPFAADIAHEQVAFYPHNLEASTWPLESKELFTYYSVFGFNFMIDLSFYFQTLEHYKFNTGCNFQHLVNALTFGQPLLEYLPLSKDRKIVRTIWGNRKNNITFTANFNSELALDLNHHTLAANGFLAETSNHKLTAGIFTHRFNRQPLSDGDHWIICKEERNIIYVFHSQGNDTALTIPCSPFFFPNHSVSLFRVFENNTKVLVNSQKLVAGNTTFFYSQHDPVFGDYVRHYEIHSANSAFLANPVLLSLPQAHSLNPDTVRLVWQTSKATNVLVEYGPTPQYGHSISDPQYVQNHDLTIKPLSPGVIYHYKIMSTDINNRSTQSGDATFILGNIGWEESFNPLKSTWNNHSALWDEMSGSTARLKKNHPFRSYGKVESEIISLNIDDFPNLMVSSKSLTPGCTYSIQLIEVGASMQKVIDIKQNISQPETTSVSLTQLLGWKGTKRFILVLWINGDTGGVTFNSMRVTR